MRTMTMTASALTFAISLGLGTAAVAGEGVHKDKDKRAETATQQHERTMHDDNMRNEMRTDKGMGMDMNKDRMRTTAVENRIGRNESERLEREFAELDRNNDGFIALVDVDANERTELALWDADEDRRLDRYEFEMAKSAQFKDLDRNNDGYLTQAELRGVKPESVTYAALDTDNDKRLSRNEYRTFIESGDWVVDRDRYAFNYIDRDRSEGIDNTEASVYAPLASAFTQYDTDGDGLIDRTQYEVFLAEVDRNARRDRVAGANNEIEQ